jgi:hypothetical protein
LFSFRALALTCFVVFVATIIAKNMQFVKGNTPKSFELF